MSSASFGSLSVTGTSGTTNLNNGLIVSSGTTVLGGVSAGNFTQTGSSTFSTGSGAVLLNGPVNTSGALTVATNLTVNGGVSSVGTVSCGGLNARTNTVTCGALNASGLISASGGIDAGSQAIYCGSLTCSSETDSGTLTVSGVLNANGGISTGNQPINAGTGGITCGSLTCSSETDSGVLTVSGVLNANGGISTGNQPINAGTGGITCGSLTCSSETDSGVLTVSGVLNANGGISTGNQAINAGTGSITCGSLTCSSETDSGSFTIGGTLYLGSGATNYLQLLQSSNAIYYDFLQSGGSHNFRYVYSGGSTSLLSMSNTAINLYQPLVTNNNNINAGTGSITCGSITSSGILQATTSTASVTSSLYTSNSLATNLYTLSIGSSYFTTNPAVNISWLNNSSTPWGLIGLSGAGGTAVNFDNNGVFIGSQAKPANSATYKLEVGGSTLLNGAVSTNNNNLTVGSGTITCGANFNIGAYGTSNLFQYSNGQLYFTNNAASAASSASANAGFNFRSLYFNGTANTYQNFLLINDKTDGTNYYNNNGLPIYAGGGMTVPSGQTLTVNGSLTVNTVSASGLITASAGLTIPSGQSLTANGGISTTTLSASGIATFSGKITANNGVYLGTGKNYVLQDPTSYVRPFNNANGCTLGFTFSAAITGTTFVNLTTTARTNIVSLDLSAGTYLIQYNVNNFGGLSGSPNYTSTYWIVGIATTSAASSGYDIDYSMDQSSASYTGNNTKSNMTVYTSIASFTVYLVSQITASATVRTQGFINATRIQ